MLWRAGSGQRQLFQLPFRTSQLNSFSIPAHSKSTPSPVLHHVQRNQEPEFKFTGRVSRTLLSKFPLVTSAFLASVEELSRSNALKDEILTRLQMPPSQVLTNSKETCTFAQEMVDKSCPEHVMHVLHVSHQLGTVLTHSQYEQIVHRLAAHSHWRYVHGVATIARERTGRWSVRLLNWTLRSYLEMQQYGLLVAVLDTFEQYQLKPTRRTYQLLVQGHLQNSDLARARDCLLRMQADGFEMNKSTFLTVLGAYRSLGPNQGVEAQAFEALHGIGERSDTFILNGLMQLRIDDGDTAGALRVLDLFTLLPLSDVDSRHGSSQEAKKFNSPPQAPPNTPPDNATFNILLSFLAQRKDGLPSVLRVFRQMQLARLEADAGTVAALIRAFATARTTGTAVAVVAEMCTRNGLSIDIKYFRRLGFSGDKIEADVLEALSVSPTTHVFNAMLQAVLPEYELDGMRAVLQIMRQACVTPDASTTQIILSYLDNTLQMRPRSLLLVLQTLATFPTEQASLTMQHMNTVLRSIVYRERDMSRTSSWNATAQRVRFGHQSSYSPERVSRKAPSFDPTAGMALTPSSNTVLGELFEPIVQSLSDRQVMSDRMTFALRIRHDAVTMRDVKSAENVFDAMVARGIRPNKYHFSALIEGYVEQGEMDFARSILERALRSGVKPNVVMYTILIIGYGRLGEPELAKRTFSEMMAAGVQPDFAAVDAVVSAYWFVRAYGTARGLLLDLWPLVARFPPELKEAPLHVLAQSLRAMRGDARSTIKPIDSPQERQRRHRVGRKLGNTLQDLKQWQQVLEAVSWAKGDMGLDHMSHMYKKTSSRQED